MVSYLQLLFILLALSASPPTTDADDQQTNKYYKCAQTSYNCGDKPYNVSFPFHFGDRPDYCGYPGYNLTCDGGDLILRMDGNDYRVVDANYSGQSIHVTSPRFDGQTCPPVASKGISLDFSLFDYSPDDVNFTIYSNCNPAIMSAFTYTYPLRCLPSNSSTASYYNVSKGISLVFAEARLACGAAAVVPITESTVNDLLRVGDGQLGKGLQAGFGLAWSIGGDWCAANCTSSGGVCGYDPADPAATPDGLTCYRSQVGESKADNAKKILIGSVTGIAGILLACLLFCLCRSGMPNFHLKKNEAQNIESFLEKYGSSVPKRYKYSDVKRMTNSFHYKLGQGGFGSVYKGTLRDGHLVAVKVLRDCKGDGEEFVNEVASIGRTSHVNVVSLLGFCSKGSKRALIYDFMCNGSLEKFIYSEAPKTTLGWEKLYQIAIGIAHGLEYLHRGCNTRIVHFDIKPHNILLDQDFCPKISDFGLAKLCPQKDSVLSMTGTRGTMGYIAPEVFSRNFGVVSSKSDVYSYGMLVLEMVGGRRNVEPGASNTSEIYFPHWVHEHFDEDECLQACGVTNETEDIARKMILIGLWCIQTMPQNRPSMGKAIDMLEGNINDLEMPPKPYLSSPLRSVVSSIS